MVGSSRMFRSVHSYNTTFPFAILSITSKKLGVKGRTSNAIRRTFIPRSNTHTLTKPRRKYNEAGRDFFLKDFEPWGKEHRPRQTVKTPAHSKKIVSGQFVGHNWVPFFKRFRSRISIHKAFSKRTCFTKEPHFVTGSFHFHSLPQLVTLGDFSRMRVKVRKVFENEGCITLWSTNLTSTIGTWRKCNTHYSFLFSFRRGSLFWFWSVQIQQFQMFPMRNHSDLREHEWFFRMEMVRKKRKYCTITLQCLKGTNFIVEDWIFVPKKMSHQCSSGKKVAVFAEVWLQKSLFVPPFFFHNVSQPCSGIQ